MITYESLSETALSPNVINSYKIAYVINIRIVTDLAFCNSLCNSARAHSAVCARFSESSSLGNKRYKIRYS